MHPCGCRRSKFRSLADPWTDTSTATGRLMIATRPPRSAIELTHSIDIRRLKRDGQVSTGDPVVLCVVANGNIQSLVRLVHLERPVFGGFRSYFLCPSCDRRCDLLYSTPHIACRICHRLAFSSENETKTFRRLRQLLKRRERLGQVKGGIVASFPAKPKWWRWPKYLRIRRQGIRQELKHWRAIHVALAGCGQRRRSS
jgi:hypothetical protein